MGLTFNGTSMYLKTGTFAGLSNGTSLTLIARFRQSANTGIWGAALVWKWPSSSGARQFFLLSYPGGNSNNASYGHSPNGSTDYAWYATGWNAFVMDYPYVLCGAHQAGTGAETLMLNSEVKTKTGNTSGHYIAAGSVFIAAGSSNGSTIDGDKYFKGTLDEILIFNRALSQAEMQTIRLCDGHAGIIEGLVSRWIFSQKGAGTAETATIPDLNKANDLTPYNSPTYSGSYMSPRKRR